MIVRMFTVAVLAAIGVMMTMPRAAAGVLNDVKAIVNGSAVNATAFHGFIRQANEADGDGNPLLQYLNSGSNGELLTLLPTVQFPQGRTFTISDHGMFGSTKTGIPNPAFPDFPVIDVVEFQSGFGGFSPTQPWRFIGKTDFADNGSSQDASNDPMSPFSSAAGGVLSLKSSPLRAGSYALSLKGGGRGGPRYAVFLFQDVGEIGSFEFQIPFGLSHASLYRVDAGGHLPEPASLAVFGLGALLGVGGSLRRRFGVRKGSSLRGLAS